MLKKLNSIIWIAVIIASAACGTARAVTPSFDCAKASTPDERTICAHARLAELDQAIARAFAQAGQQSKDEAQKIAVQSLGTRHACGANPICILDQQVEAIGDYSYLGSTVSVPLWVAAYRYQLFKERGGSRSAEFPTRVGQCAVTQIGKISTRFGGELKEPETKLLDPGSVVNYTNQGHQVSYSFVPSLYDSRVGDHILLCLASLPKNCPLGDSRGQTYSATNLRTGGSWLLPDAQHSCGGA
jgi:uncharacterized protein